MIYRLHYNKMADDFIELNSQAFKDIQVACINSEFQKIDKQPVEEKTSDDSGGMIFPDFMYDDAIPLFSESLFNAMKKAGADNLFEKEVIVNDSLQELSQKYILALPPRIDVLDSIQRIDESRIGNYLIFKIADPSDNNIYIVESLMKLFKEIKPLGMEIIEANVL